MMELQALHEATGKVKKRTERLDWMYSAGPSGNKGMVDEVREAYLLGKKRVDKLVEQGKSVKEIEAAAVFAAKANVYGMTANSVRDTQAKIKDDPLLAIKKREHASLQAVLNNPVELKKLKEGKSGKKDKKDKKIKKEKKEKKHKKRARSASEDSGDDRHRKGRDWRRGSHDVKEERDLPYRAGPPDDRRHDSRRRSRSPVDRERNGRDWRRDSRDVKEPDLPCRAGPDDRLYDSRRRSRSPGDRRYDSRRRSRSPVFRNPPRPGEYTRNPPRPGEYFGTLPESPVWSPSATAPPVVTPSFFEDEYHRLPHRRPSRSQSPRQRSRSRSRSPYRSRHVSRSPPRRRRASPSPSPPLARRPRFYSPHRSRPNTEEYQPNAEEFQPKRKTRPPPSPPKQPPKSESETDAFLESARDEYESRQKSDRERRLAEMMQDAETWDEARTKRIEEERKKDAEEHQRDMEARMKRLNDVGGSNGEGFLRDLQRQTYSGGNASAADMIRRNRAFAQRDGSFM